MSVCLEIFVVKTAQSKTDLEVSPQKNVWFLEVHGGEETEEAGASGQERPEWETKKRRHVVRDVNRTWDIF